MRALIPALFLALLPACASSPPAAQGDRAEVLAAAEAFFGVIASRDAAAGARLVVPEGVFVNVRDGDGVRLVKHFSNAEWLAELGDDEPPMREAWLGEPTVLIDGDVAVVWGRYEFEIDGTRSHVGTDAFCLVRTDDGWRVAGGAYSVER